MERQEMINYLEKYAENYINDSKVQEWMEVVRTMRNKKELDENQIDLVENQFKQEIESGLEDIQQNLGDFSRIIYTLDEMKVFAVFLNEFENYYLEE